MIVILDGNNLEFIFFIFILIFDGYIFEVYEGEEYLFNFIFYYKEVELNGCIKKKVYLMWIEVWIIVDWFVNFSSLDVFVY